MPKKRAITLRNKYNDLLPTHESGITLRGLIENHSIFAVTTWAQIIHCMTFKDDRIDEQCVQVTIIELLRQLWAHDMIPSFFKVGMYEPILQDIVDYYHLFWQGTGFWTIAELLNLIRYDRCNICSYCGRNLSGSWHTRFRQMFKRIKDMTNSICGHCIPFVFDVEIAFTKNLKASSGVSLEEYRTEFGDPILLYQPRRTFVLVDSLNHIKEAREKKKNATVAKRKETMAIKKNGHDPGNKKRKIKKT
jgi:hypothetical protein